MGLDRGKRWEMDANEWHLHRNLEMFTEKIRDFTVSTVSLQE